MKLDMRK